MDFMGLEYFSGVQPEARAQRRAMLFARAERMMEALEWRVQWAKNGHFSLKDQERKPIAEMMAPPAPPGVGPTSWQRIFGVFQAIKIFQNQGLL